MNVLNRCFQALQDEIGRRNEADKVADAIKALASVTDILKSSTTSEATFKKLSLILRSRMLPLYRIAFKFALQYASAVLAALLEIKDEILEDARLRSSWENVQESLLSGILDYLEQHQTNEKKTFVASMFYTLLCHEFFPRQDKFTVNAQDGLLCTIFRLLSESVMCHPDNQHKLREPNVLGGKRLGLMLKQCKDFLAMEALLELVGNIIPSAKNPERQFKFIQEVFDPALFACSFEIVQLLERVKSTGWDATSTKICDVLAKSDPTYPQPFETTQIRTQETSYTISRIYIDINAFIASVDEGEQLETFRLPFNAVKQIQVSAPSTFMVVVTVSVTSSPLLGHSPIIRHETDNMSIAFDLKKEKIHTFVTALRKRGLRCITACLGEKQSKAESNVELAFRSRENIDPPPLEEKIGNLTKLWKSSKLPIDNNQISSTSPLHAFPDGISDAKVEQATAASARDQDLERETPPKTPGWHVNVTSHQENPQHIVVFGASDEELSEISDAEAEETDNKVQLVGSKNTTHAETKRTMVLSDNTTEEQNTKTGLYREMRNNSEISNCPEVFREVSIGQSERIIHLRSGELGLQSLPQQSNRTSLVSSYPEPKPIHTSGRRRKGNRVLSIQLDAETTHPGAALDGKPTSHTQVIFPSRAPVDHAHNAKYKDIYVWAEGESVATESVMRSLRTKVAASHQEDTEVPAPDEHRSPSPGKSTLRLGARNVPSYQEKSVEKKSSADEDNARVIIDLTDDDSKNADVRIVDLIQNATERVAGVIKPGVDLSKTTRDMADSMDMPIRLTNRTLPRVPYEEKMMSVHVHRSPSQEMEMTTSRSSIGFPPPLKDNFHAASVNKRTRIKSPQKQPRAGTHNQAQVHRRPQNRSWHRKSDTEVIPKIIEVVDRLHEVVVNNISKKFNNVKKDIRVAQLNILEGAKEDLQEMQKDSALYYNKMVDLANEYANHERKMIHAIGQLVRLEEDMVEGVTDVIHQHDKLSLSSKFPRTLLPVAHGPFSASMMP
ncbi:hypothetical protein APHAL10511_007024 [Amanita phalloides]|nr:hypothetical protein APHAL10511_007024 [Amanita phalloides]